MSIALIMMCVVPNIMIADALDTDHLNDARQDDGEVQVEKKNEDMERVPVSHLRKRQGGPNSRTLHSYAKIIDASDLAVGEVDPDLSSRLAGQDDPEHRDLQDCDDDELSNGEEGDNYFNDDVFVDDDVPTDDAALPDDDDYQGDEEDILTEVR